MISVKVYINENTYEYIHMYFHLYQFFAANNFVKRVTFIIIKIMSYIQIRYTQKDGNKKRKCFHEKNVVS